jgi:hypothetical protein
MNRRCYLYSYSRYYLFLLVCPTLKPTTIIVLQIIVIQQSTHHLFLNSFYMNIKDIQIK